MLEHLHGQKELDEGLDKHVKGQRLFLYLLGAFIVLGVSFSAFTSCTKPDSAPEENEKPSTPSEPETKVESEASKDPLKRFSRFSTLTNPTIKPQNQANHSVAIVSYPWRDWRQSKTISGAYGNRPELLQSLPERGISRQDYLSTEVTWEMPKDKAWLPLLDREMAYAICDSNTRLEAIFSRRNEEVLPRIGSEVNWEGVKAVSNALSAQHVIVINFAVKSAFSKQSHKQQGGLGWQIWSYSQGDKTDPTMLPDATRWPQDKGFEALRLELRKEVHRITGVPTKTSPMPKDDAYGKALANLKELLLRERFEQATTAFKAMQTKYPADEASHYCFYEYTKDFRAARLTKPQQAKRALAHTKSVEALYDYVDKGGKSLRLRTLMAANLAYDPGEGSSVPASRIARGVLGSVLKDDPFFFEAYNQERALAEYDENGDLKELGLGQHYRRMRALFPKEARFIVGEAVSMVTDPNRAAEALALLDEAADIAPWLRGVYFHRSTAHIAIADKLRRETIINTEAVKKHYDLAYRFAMDGWKLDRADFRYWLVNIGKALAYGRSEHNAPYNVSQGHPRVPNDLSHLMPLYCAASIHGSAYSARIDIAHSRRILEKIFAGERTAWYDKHLGREVDKILNGTFTGHAKGNHHRSLEATDLELVLLAGVLRAGSLYLQNQSKKSLDRLQQLLDYYRSLGARSRLIDDTMGKLIR